MDESLINIAIERALEIIQKPYEKNEILSLLENGDEFEKPVAIMALENLCNKNEADLLINNLTGCDGRIREASALKISEFLKNSEIAPYFFDERSLETILNGIMDINPNVGRALIDGIKECQPLQKLILPKLIDRILNIIEKLKALSDTPYADNKLKNTKNHAKNKIVFNLYWALEALYYTDFNNFTQEKLLDILNFTSGYIDYTIREKTAKILSKMNEQPSDLLQKLKNDKNFYVKNQLLC
jgi:hypothetical protein